MNNPTSGFVDSKQHFLILDGLRGIAAIMVVLMHTFEIFCGGDYHKMIINHGYLAVDFFFMLSGYVMAHAYDDRWNNMTLLDFFKRRLIRLHPLILLGMTFGALTFYLQASPAFPKIVDTSVWQLLLVLLIGYTLIPIPPKMDIRGWNEMHPLNGPAWSLFFEYIANLLHVFILRKLSKWVLSFFTLLAGIALVHYVTTGPTGDLIGGWSCDPQQLKIGFTRLLFPYMAGMLLRRVVRVLQHKNTFIPAALLLIGVLIVPRIGGRENLWMNGLYESMVIILIFPIIIYLGAIGEVRNKQVQKLGTFLGDISYPLYITHFPFICIFYAWVSRNNIPLEQGAWLGVMLTIVYIAIAYASLKLYDIPVRKWLSDKFMKAKID